MWSCPKANFDYEFILTGSLFWMVLEMVRRWPYTWHCVACCFHDIFNRAVSILAKFTPTFFSIPLVSVLLAHPCSRIDMPTDGKNCVLFYHISLTAAVVSILLYGCTTWTLTKRLERRLDGNYTRMLRAVLNKSWRQHPTRLQLYGHLPPITKTIQVRRTRHAGHCWRSKDELISDVLLWTPTHGCASVGRPARTYIQQLCEDTGCNPEDLPEAMSDREKWRETVRDIRADGATWWWWWYIYI